MSKTKREAICEAALTLFAEKGVDATTTREIAARAETAEGNLYRHFKGKDDLVRCLFEESAKQFHDTLRRSVGGLADPGERLTALVKGIFAFADENPKAFAYLLTAPHSEVVRNRDPNWRPLPMQLFVETLESGFSAGVFRAVDPALATGWIVALTQRAIVLLGTKLLSVPRAEVMAQTVEAALRLVQSDGEDDR